MANVVALREMSDEQISELLENAREEMFNLRFQKATGSLENTSRIRDVRREIARFNEILGKREWAVAEAAAQPEIEAALADADWSGSAQYDYEEGVWMVTLTDSDNKTLATAQVDLNKKRRPTRRKRNSMPPVEKVVAYEVA